MSARILNVSEAEYFADPCSKPSLSQSVAKILVSESPQHAWLAHPRLGNQRSEPTAALDEGTIIHKLLLGKGAAIEVIDAPDFRTKAAQSARDVAIECSRVPVLRSKFDALQTAADQLRDRCSTLGYELNGESEVAIEWEEPTSDGPVLCRARLDHVFMDRGVIYDVKKTRTANPKYLKRNFVDLGYDIQRAAYTRALAALCPDLAGRIKFEFLFVEVAPPYSVVPVVVDGAFREIGAQRWSQAVHVWQRCLASGRFPGYCDRAVTLEAPPYVVAEYLGNWSE